MSKDWEINLISEPFELKQNEYDCNSTFIIFLSKAGVDYDRDDFGDLILDYEEWGTIDPPGPNKGFGSKIDPDFLEELWDEECRSKLTIKKLKDTGDLKELSEEIFPYIDGIFNEKRRLFKLKAYLTTDILANYRLNDEFVIQDRTFRINSISTNFKTEVSNLELLNKL